jgi:hypothetical protein
MALERAGHVSPVRALVDHGEAVAEACITWLPPGANVLGVLDRHRLTEDAAEGIALSYVHATGRWRVKRRLQQAESADWLLQRDGAWLALEVSGVAQGDGRSRFLAKRKQVAHCSVGAELLAVVVAFRGPAILAGAP